MKKHLLQLNISALFLVVGGIALATPHTPPVRSLDIPGTNAVIAMDGVADADYSAEQSTTSFSVIGSTGADADYTLTFQVCYNYQKLYFLATILDDYACEIPYTTSANPWTYDNVEVFLSIDTTGTTAAYDSNTIQLRFNRGIRDSAQTPGRAAQEDYQVYYENTADGWVLEAGIPWTAVLQEGALPEDIEAYVYAGAVNGFDVSGADNDTDGPDARDCQVAWDDDDPAMPDATEDLAWNNRTMFGVMQLALPEVNINYNTNNSNSKIQLVPNPSSDFIQLKNLEKPCAASIFGISGNLVLRLENVENDEEIAISMLPSGIYTILLNNEEAVRFVKE
jgi:hypothetical protein